MAAEMAAEAPSGAESALEMRLLSPSFSGEAGTARERGWSKGKEGVPEDEGDGGGTDGGGDGGVPYDPDGMAWQEAATMVVAIIIGVAVLGMPGAVSALGWVFGVLIIVFFSAVNQFSGYAITNSFVAAAHVLGRHPRTYGDLGLAAAGPRGEKIIHILQYGQIWMICVAIQDIASNNLTYVARAAGGDLCAVAGQAVVVVAVLPFLQLQQLRDAAWLGAFGVLTIFITLVLYFTQMASDADKAPTTAQMPRSTTTFEALTQIMTVCFAYMGQAIFPEIQSEMARPTDFKRSISAASVVLAVVYITVGAVGYGIIGPGAPLLYKWDEKKNPYQGRTTAACAFLTAHVLVGYIINASVINQALAKRIGITRVSDTGKPKPANAAKWFALTLCTEASYWFVANLIPSVSDLMGLIAATGGIALMITAPATFVLRLGAAGEHEKLYSAIQKASVALMALCTIAAVYQLANASSGNGPFAC